jgi:23S rRNA pseudouridine1911/1915/1917 synthase
LNPNGFSCVPRYGENNKLRAPPLATPPENLEIWQTDHPCGTNVIRGPALGVGHGTNVTDQNAGATSETSPCTIAVDRGDAGRRLDLVLRRHLASIRSATRTRVQGWIANGRVSINGKPVCRAAARVSAADRVTIALPDVCTPRPPIAEEAALDVLYEDSHLLAINKPAGMVVHPSYRNIEGTLLNALLGHARAWPERQRPSLVGRLDKLTSGIVLVAKSAAVHAALQRILRSSTAEKSYLAIVYGCPAKAGTIALPLEIDPRNRRRVTSMRGRGAPSVTTFECLARLAAPRAGVSLLRCRLITGRRHQIRAHLALAGWPLVGDPDYGEPRWKDIVDRALADALRAFPRQALHSWRLRFDHPVTGERVMLEAPLPGDLDRLLNVTGMAFVPGANYRIL